MCFLKLLFFSCVHVLFVGMRFLDCGFLFFLFDFFICRVLALVPKWRPLAELVLRDRCSEFTRTNYSVTENSSFAPPIARWLLKCVRPWGCQYSWRCPYRLRYFRVPFMTNQCIARYTTFINLDTWSNNRFQYNVIIFFYWATVFRVISSSLPCFRMVQVASRYRRRLPSPGAFSSSTTPGINAEVCSLAASTEVEFVGSCSRLE